MIMISNLRLTRSELTRREKKKRRLRSAALGALIVAALSVFLGVGASLSLLNEREAALAQAWPAVKKSAVAGEAGMLRRFAAGIDTGTGAGALPERSSPLSAVVIPNPPVTRFLSAHIRVPDLPDPAAAPEEIINWSPFYVESESLVPIHLDAGDTSDIVGSLNPGALVYGFYENDGWVCIADANNALYYVKSANIIPFNKEMSEISLFPDDHEVISGGFTADTNINSISGMTLEDISFLLRERPALQEIGEAALLFEKKYGVNAYFILGVASQESAYGTSALARLRNNLFGLGAYDVETFENALNFTSKSESVEYFCILISKYRESGRTTPAAISKRYASDEFWPGRVVQLMNFYSSNLNEKTGPSTPA